MIAVSYFERIESASKPADLFEDADKGRAIYRRLARIVHPDVNPDHSDRAAEAFAKLSRLWDEFNGKYTGPRTGPSSATPPRAPGAGLVFETRRRVYAVDELLTRGDISNVYGVQYQEDSQILRGVVKLPRSPKNSDLVKNEISALKTLKESVPDEYKMYHVKPLDTFNHKDRATGKVRTSIVLEDLDGFVSLRDVIEAYPQGIPGRHVAWIARRLFVALDVAHEAGLAHGAVFPEHVMIHPKMHGVVLIDWSYSAETGSKLKTAVPQYMKLGWYGKAYDKPLDHRLDVRQAAHTLEALFADQTGVRPFRAFFNGCRVASAPTAGELFEEFDELLERLYGKRKYVPFEMPKGWKKGS